MIKDNVVKDAMEKIVNQKMTIEAVSDEYADDKVVDENQLEEKLEDLIEESLRKALTNYSDQQVLTWNKKWKPNWAKMGTTREQLLKVPVEIKGMSNITVDNLMHANDDIKNKLENFIKEFK